jgi:hypothetical protein
MRQSPYIVWSCVECSRLNRTFAGVLKISREQSRVINREEERLGKEDRIYSAAQIILTLPPIFDSNSGDDMTSCLGV